MCKECYSDDLRATPLINPEHCLKNHTQYICSTCGRCICIERDKKRGLYRWNFPFKTLEIAKLYLKTAEIACEHICGIYEIKNKKGRKSYKIFQNENELIRYLKKNPNKICESMKPVYISKEYVSVDSSHIRKLNQDEIDQYLKEQNIKK